MDNLTIIHVDMDAFYASIEQRDNPAYRHKPVIIGGEVDGRGVVSTASYEARKYGVHSAMSCRQAKELCPKAIFLPVNMSKYKKVSDQIHSIFKNYTHIIEPISIDEAFLDIQNKDTIYVAQKIKNDIYNSCHLTASVGVSYNKFLAKLASDMEKPDGFTVITPEKACGLLPGLSIRKIWGVGEKTEKELNDIGIFTVKDLLDYDKEFLLKIWGRRAYELISLAQGIDQSPVVSCQQTKSIGEETTLPDDTFDVDVLKNHLNMFSLAIGKRISNKRLKCRTVTVKIKYSDFQLISRSITLSEPIYSALPIYKYAEDILLNRISLSKPVRLIGIQVSNIIYPYQPVQLTIKDFLNAEVYKL